MIAATLYRAGAAPQPIDVDHLDKHCGSDDGVLWADLVNPSTEELAHVAEEFSLHPLALESALQANERPAMERFPSHGFVVVYAANNDKVSLFFTTTWLICVRGASTPPWQPELVRDRFNVRHAARPSVAALVYEILDNIVDGHEESGDAFVDEIDEIEDRILEGGAVSREVEKEVLQLRRRLIHARRRISPVRDVIQELRRSRDDQFDDPEIDLGLADVGDHALRVVDQIDTHRDLLASAFETHLATMSNQMNLVMRQLSAWGAIALAATLIAGIYGMNFTHMPELDWRVGYPMALGLMVVVGFTLYRLFKRRDWL